MNEAKIFRVIGEIVKPNFRTSFKKEVRALKPEDALEKIYHEFGSKHRAKRYQIKAYNVEVITLDEVENPILKKFVTSEEKTIGD